MVDPHASDQEQLEAIKKWWQDNGKAIIIGIIVGLVAIFGWRFGINYLNTQAEKASLYFNNLTQAATNQDAAAARQQGQVLLDDFSGSAYGILAAFKLAKLAVDEGDNAAAIKNLQWVLAHADQEEMKTIARLRLAQVLAAEERLDEATALLDQVDMPSFSGQLEELRGDIHRLRGDLAKARAAYEAALAAQGAASGGSLLQLKLDNLSPP